VSSTVPSIKIQKTMNFKGASHVWSNRYHFTGGTPSSDANWKLLSDAIVNLEKTIFVSNVTIVGMVAYAAGSEVPVSSKVYSTAGTLTGPSVPCPAECVALARWSTASRSSKNHPIYAYSYWHAVHSSGGVPTNYDKVDTTQKTAMNTYAAGWVSGITAGGVTAVRATPAGHVATGVLIEQWITHRDFPPSSSV